MEVAANRRPILQSHAPTRCRNYYTRRLVAGAASLAALAAVATIATMVARTSPSHLTVLVERLPDTGEDYFSAIEQV